MDGRRAPRPRPTAAATAVAVLLAAALVGAGVHIGQLRAQLAAARELLAPFSATARTLYPDADPATALRSVGERLDTLLASRRAPAPPAAGADAAPVEAADLLTPAQEEAIAGVLRAETDAGRKAWFLVAQGNRETAAAQREMQRVFESAGWAVQVERAPYPLKAGIFLLAGDETPPAFVDRVSDAFDAGGIEVQYLTGYRDFTRSRQAENPSWVGPTLAGDQAFTIVVGSTPRPKAAE